MAKPRLCDIRKHRAAAHALKDQIDGATPDELRLILDELAYHNREIRRLNNRRHRT